MPPSSIPRRVEDIIFYYYAKLVIAPSAGFRGNYQFILHMYKRLKDGDVRMSDYERELLHLARNQGWCAFCGVNKNKLGPVHVVPRHLGGPIGMHNLVMACETCAQSKSERDFVEWWCNGLGKNRDEIPRVPLGLYLKIAYELHKVNFSLRKPCQSLEKLFTILQ